MIWSHADLELFLSDNAAFGLAVCLSVPSERHGLCICRIPLFWHCRPWLQSQPSTIPVCSGFQSAQTNALVCAAAIVNEFGKVDLVVLEDRTSVTGGVGRL